MSSRARLDGWLAVRAGQTLGFCAEFAFDNSLRQVVNTPFGRKMMMQRIRPFWVRFTALIEPDPESWTIERIMAILIIMFIVEPFTIAMEWIMLNIINAPVSRGRDAHTLESADALVGRTAQREPGVDNTRSGDVSLVTIAAATSDPYTLDSPLREQNSQGGSNLLASSRAWGHLLALGGHLLAPSRSKKSVLEYVILAGSSPFLL